MAEFDPSESPHRRYNPLTGRHVLVSPHRTKRPWNTEAPVVEKLNKYEPKCYLCPGNKRMNGESNARYKDTFNDFPALLPPPSGSSGADKSILLGEPTGDATVDALFETEHSTGRCSVICFHPRHDLTLARMPESDIVNVIERWRDVYLAETKWLRANGQENGYVQIFENRGAMMGASAPHPHGQVWTLSYVPDEPATELSNLVAFADKAGGKAQANGHSLAPAPCRDDGAPCLLCTYAHAEVAKKARVVVLDEESGWVALVPFWAVWPFETLVLPYKRHIPSLAEMTPQEDAGLARVLRKLLIRYDNLFKASFPYSMGLHQAPTAPTAPESDPAHAHFHFYPPLLRSATVRKFLVGFEMLAEAQRDLTPEQAAQRLRDLPERHYVDTDIETMDNAARPVPQIQSTDDAYLLPTAEKKRANEWVLPSALSDRSERWASFLGAFKTMYGSEHTHVVRAPGRVNILGEHVDYSLFPVLPAAIDQDMLVALRTLPDARVVVANTTASFKPADFSLTHNGKAWDVGLVTPNDGGKWENYFKAALLEVLEKYFPGGQSKDGVKPVGMEALVTGNVPPGAGLSSSAAFIVASVLAVLTANNLMDNVTKGDLVAMAISSEHRLGLRTGGMDQSASVLALRETLLHMSFHPKLEAEALPFPKNLAIVITNSLVPHALADSAAERYNLRVVEVLCASRLLLKAWGVDRCKGVSAGKDARIWLKEALELKEQQAGSGSELYRRALADLPSVLGKNGRGETGWTREEMIEASGMCADDFATTYLDFIPVRAERFMLLQRAKHTFTESLRVNEFVDVCNALTHEVNAHPDDKAKLDDMGRKLGALINGSHESLRDLYDATVPEVETLRDICLKHGAYGARQTGGGWGGAVISLLPQHDVERFLAAVRAEYEPFKGLPKDELEEASFATQFAQGATVGPLPKS